MGKGFPPLAPLEKMRKNVWEGPVRPAFSFSFSISPAKGLSETAFQSSEVTRNLRSNQNGEGQPIRKQPLLFSSNVWVVNRPQNPSFMTGYAQSEKIL